MPESKEFSAWVISGRRVTIPEGIGFDLDIEEGDRVKVVITKSPIQKPYRPRRDTII